MPRRAVVERVAASRPEKRKHRCLLEDEAAGDRGGSPAPVATPEHGMGWDGTRRGRSGRRRAIWQYAVERRSHDSGDGCAGQGPVVPGLAERWAGVAAVSHGPASMAMNWMSARPASLLLPLAQHHAPCCPTAGTVVSRRLRAGAFVKVDVME